MTVGMILAALAFVAAALVQLQIDETLPKLPTGVAGQVKFLNLATSQVQLNINSDPISNIQPFQSSGDYLTFDKPVSVNLNNTNTTYLLQLQSQTRKTALIVQDGPVPIIDKLVSDFPSKPNQGANAIRFVNAYPTPLSIEVADLSYGSIITNNISDYQLLPQGSAEFTLMSGTGEKCLYTKQLGFGSSLTLVIPNTFSFPTSPPDVTPSPPDVTPDCVQDIQEIVDILPNTMHMAWQIPQYFLMTSGEVIFSVTGLDFSYSQAPSNMKSVLQAGWLFTVAVGNIIVLIVGELAQLPDQWAEYILFASLLVAVSIVFAIMGYFYTYVDPTEIEAQFQTKPDEEKKKRDSVEHNEKKERKVSSSSSSSSEDEEVKQTKI